MIRIFHHDDPDGYCANYIALNHFSSIDIKSYEMNYNKKFPMEDIESKDVVLILDYSISPEEMTKLLAITTKVVWIDHHKSSIEKYKDFKEEIGGIRKDGWCGAYLTWQYFNKDRSIPYWLKLIDAWDCWKQKDGKWEDENTKPFIFGIQSEQLDSEAMWDKIVTDIEKYVEAGKVIIKYNDIQNEQICKQFGWEMEWEGIKVFICNTPDRSSETFGDRLKKFDALVAYTWVGKDKKYSVSIYSANPDVDCSKIAMKFGGGGHKGAAGFSSEKPTFLE